jgi:transmembrane sensor
MATETDYYKQLLQRYLDNDCTPQEVEEVLHFLQQDSGARVLLEQMQQEFDRAMDQEYSPLPAGKKMQSRLMEKIGPGPFRQSLYRRIGFRVAVAALLVLLLGAGVYYLFLHTPRVKETARNTTVPAVPATLPGRNKAYITMANGEQVTLDSAAGTQRLQEQGNIVQLTNDQVTYRTDSLLTPDSYRNHVPLTYNTLTVPRGGGMVTLTLADGTRVWINAASSIRYPTAFTGHERMVELTGEAYFEVTHDRGRPFAVRTPQVAVQVLGTRFNVSAYEEDGQQQVVLVDGSVKVTTDTKNNSQLLSPGQMASYTNGGQLTVTAVNAEEYTSWTKGYLLLKRTPWEQLMRRLSRHYDVSINTHIPAFKEETFSGRLDLQANLEDMMNLICTGTPFIYQPTERKLIRR